MGIVALILMTFFGLLIITLFILMIANNYSDSIWFCKYMGWHKADEDANVGFDGCSFESKCKRCKKHLLMDSWGQWF